MITPDTDLQSMGQEELVAEIKRLRDAIRQHMLEKGHGRCWVDDHTLYSSLPEGDISEKTLPKSEEFFHECGKYAKSCLGQGRFSELGESQVYFENFAARCARYWASRQGDRDESCVLMVPDQSTG